MQARGVSKIPLVVEIIIFVHQSKPKDTRTINKIIVRGWGRFRTMDCREKGLIVKREVHFVGRLCFQYLSLAC